MNMKTQYMGQLVAVRITRGGGGEAGPLESNDPWRKEADASATVLRQTSQVMVHGYAIGAEGVKMAQFGGEAQGGLQEKNSFDFARQGGQPRDCSQDSCGGNHRRSQPAGFSGDQRS